MEDRALEVSAGRTDQLRFDLLVGMFALRKRVFVDELAWVRGGSEHEIDVFDTLGPHYVVVHRDSEVVATVRLMPMTQPSMLREVFPGLLCGQDCPAAPGDWELSRFAARSPGGGVPFAATPQTLALIRGAVRHAVSLGARRLFAVSDVRMERLLRRLGFPIRRLGPATRLGAVLAVVGWIGLEEALPDLSALSTDLPDLHVA